MYLTADDVLPDLPYATLLQALEDGENAVAVTFEMIDQRSSEAVDAILGQRFDLPLEVGSAAFLVAKEAARIFALETLYKRRGFHGDQNPWHNAAMGQRSKLNAIIKKTEPLGATGAASSKPPVTAVAVPARSHSSRFAG